MAAQPLLEARAARAPLSSAWSNPAPGGPVLEGRAAELWRHQEACFSNTTPDRCTTFTPTTSVGPALHTTSPSGLSRPAAASSGTAPSVGRRSFTRIAPQAARSAPLVCSGEVQGASLTVRSTSPGQGGVAGRISGFEGVTVWCVHAEVSQGRGCNKGRERVWEATRPGVGGGAGKAGEEEGEE